MRCDDIFGFGQITEAVISPDGDAVAFVQKTANRRLDRYDVELCLARVPGAAGSGFTGSLGPGLHGAAWAPGGRTLAAVERRPGAPAASVVIASGVDGSRRRLVDGVTGPASVAWSPDGEEVAFLAVSLDGGTGSVPAPALAGAAAVIVRDLSAKIDGLGVSGSWCRHLFAVNCRTGAVRQLTAGDLWVDDFCYSRSSGLIAFCGSGPWAGAETEGAPGPGPRPEPRPGAGLIPRQPGAVRPSELWVMSRDTGARRHLATGEASPRSLLFGPGDQVIFAGGPQSRADLTGLFAVPAEGGPVRRLAGSLDRGVVVGSAILAAPDADELIFCARDGGCMRAYRTSLRARDGVQPVAGSPEESVSAVSASRRGGRLGYVSSTRDGCQHLIVQDLRSGSRSTLTRTAPPAEVRPAERREFTARDGLGLEGWLIRGRARGRAPLLVDVHGGSFSGAWSPVVQPSRLYQQELAEGGWTVLLLNARGSDGYGSEFARAAVGAWGEADAPDFHDAIDALIGQEGIDPARLAVTGYSYGGFMSNWLTATSDRFSAAVAGGSICDFVSLFGTSDMGWAMSEYDIGVHPHLDPLGALRRSPAGFSRAVRTPTLLLHGDADLRCPISQAEEWLAMLLGSGCEAALVRYPGASHGFLTQGPPSMAADYGNRLVHWVTSHVPGG
jgi:dipeptidyl aminopeptidase/acylaminoacyl peptidase